MKLAIAVAIASTVLIAAFLLPNSDTQVQAPIRVVTPIHILEETEHPAPDLCEDTLIVGVQTPVREDADRAILSDRESNMRRILKVVARSGIRCQARLLIGVDTIFFFVQQRDAKRLAHFILNVAPTVDEIFEIQQREDVGHCRITRKGEEMEPIHHPQIQEGTGE